VHSRPGLLVLLVIVASALVLPACRTLRMGRDVPLDLLGQEPEDEPEPGEGPPAVVDESASQPDERVASIEPRTWLTRRQLTSAGSNSQGRWDAEGTQIIFQSIRSGGTIANPNPQTWMMEATGERQRRITMGIGVTNGPGFIASSGRQVYYASTHHTGKTPGTLAESLPEDMELYRQDLDRGGFERLTESPGFDGEASWCGHDGLVVFTSTRSGDAELYALADGGTTRLTEAPGADLAPALSPDCTRLAWVRDGALLVASADGAASQILMPSDVREVAWHPDGLLLIFSASPAPGEPAELFTVKPDGSDLRRLTASSGSEEGPSFSPDGKRLLYSWDRTGTHQLFVADWDASMGTPWTLQVR
jgi:Tol biopolymer transport system component